MQIFWESRDWPGARLEARVTCLSWMKLSEESQGLLGSGSESGSVGITRTDSCAQSDPHNNRKRINFNLRGHHSPISMVGWNGPQSKLATCDESGIIYVWVPYEERWSVELVNDRGVKVRDFSWSPSGSAALICYEDSFVLIGSASGQRIWSNIFPEPICAGAWSPDSSQVPPDLTLPHPIINGPIEVVLGCQAGRLRLLTDNGAPVAEYPLRDAPIKRISWSPVRPREGKSTIAVYFADGSLRFMDSADDPDPTSFDANLHLVSMEWSTSGDHLLVGGYPLNSAEAPYDNQILVFNAKGGLVMRSRVPMREKKLSALCWGEEAEWLVVAVGECVGVGRALNGVPALHFLSSRRVWEQLEGRRERGESVGITALPLPARDKNLVASHDYHIVQCRIPHPDLLLQSVCRGSPFRSYCTIAPQPRTPGTFVLCMEHMGGLVPILKGRQTNKLLPEFEIRVYRSADDKDERSRSGTPELEEEESLDSLPGPSTLRRAGTGGFGRDSMWRRSKRKIADMVHRAQSFNPNSTTAPAARNEVEERLVSISSNVWCTRFKMVGLNPSLLPPYLGQVLYKTSVLHLQPRQMTVHVVDLSDPSIVVSAPLPPPFSTEDLDSEPAIHEGPPIAPMETEIFLGDHPPLHNNNHLALDNAAAVEEDEALLDQVLTEFNDLRNAVDAHITRMRDFASELGRSSAQLRHTGASPPPLHSQLQRFLEVSERLSGRAPSRSPQPQPASLPSSSPARLPALSRPPSSPVTPKRRNPLRNSFMSRAYWKNRHNSPSAVLFQSFGRKKKTPSMEMTKVEVSEAEIPSTSGVTTSQNVQWNEQLQDIQFIDEDETLQVTEESERRRLRARALSCTGSERIERDPPSAAFGQRTESEQLNVICSSPSPSPTPSAFRRGFRRSSKKAPKQDPNQLSEISSVLEKLYKLASDLRPKPSTASSGEGSSTNANALLPPHPLNGGKVAPNRRRGPALLLMEEEGGETLRTRVREIAARVGQLEARITAGNELLDHVRIDLHTRVGRIRSVLGDQPSPIDKEAKDKSLKKEDSHARVLVLQNKAPFWNEQSQVYQLDFGGRVTQESAKNFQVELDVQVQAPVQAPVQVMQFGRIEAGAYTLDFQAPFSAAQAFAVALASITQRLK